jgi:multiple sugar transport system ATP-binding protein
MYMVNSNNHYEEHNMASVTFENVTKVFGDVVAVDDLNIHIEDKEFLVFVGPSGCGKTTSLRMLAGLEEPTEGNIYIGDRLVNDVPPKDRDIAMVFQSYALYPHMTGFDNMSFGLKLRRTPKNEIDERVSGAARELTIRQLLERKPRELSGGERQRMAVGRAIVREPKVFLMDEPLSNLDAKLRVEARAMLQRLHRRLETTFVYVTHDQMEAMTMGSRIAVMRDGVLQQVDKPQRLYDCPANAFVAGFIGSPSMNFFDATLRQDNGDLYIETAGFRIAVPENRRASWETMAGRAAILGVRPEDIHDSAYVPPELCAAEVEAMVDVVEPLGNEAFLYLQSGGLEYIARVDPRTDAQAGGRLIVAMCTDNMHLFDGETEQAIR